MTNMKHTPGPWRVEPLQADHGATLAIVSHRAPNVLAEIPYNRDDQTDDEPNGETVVRHPCDEANARLIAAAPDLLEFARANFSRANLSDDELGDLARAAIAKAEGAK